MPNESPLFDDAFVYRPFPSIPVEVAAKVLVHRGHNFIVADEAMIWSRGMRVRTSERLPIGALVDLEFTLVDEIHPYVGEGRVANFREPEEFGPGKREKGEIEVRFTRLSQQPLTLRERLRDFDRIRRVTTQTTFDMIKYTRSQLTGNKIPDKDFGQPGAGHRRPLLLIHGFLGTRGAMLVLERRLKVAGIPVFSFPLGVLNIDDIAKSASRIAQKVETVLERYQLEEIDVLGHSMGGLIGLYYLTKLGGNKRVRRLVTIGTPYQGAWLASAALVAMPWTGLVAQSMWQLKPDSDFLKDLRAAPLPDDADVVSIIAKNDSVVDPRCCVLKGARNIMISTNHAGLVVSPKVFQRIDQALAKD
ncbi:MAG: alpha/beta fold hydrolase [Deltaproteobacteria bacterium]|nr:alpha/beta fold hydrolase [bacterium]MCB9477018.1 alpha/beta fold hydrolase [Deltaproteobacteria bacterium]MCB9479640.1 alpha/beta fold hydrolase [Deltaproteobacteria bacterium]MCB9489863.1 alpha/beta fold hydrolase [Deltaproteobacteria bacterium]